MFSPLEQFSAIWIQGWGLLKEGAISPQGIPLLEILGDFSFLHIFIPLLVLKLIYICYFSFALGRKESVDLIPDAFIFRFYELQLVFIFNLVKQQLGQGNNRYVPLITYIFFSILGLNLLSLLPLGIAFTSHVEGMLFLSLWLGSTIFLIGFQSQGFNIFFLFIPTCPLFMLPFLVLIEIFSYIIRIFSLAIRLSANITAGHTLVYIISTFLLKVIFSNYIFFLIGLCFLSAIWILEIGVAFLQAYVFTILVLIYLNDSLKSSHH